MDTSEQEAITSVHASVPGKMRTLEVQRRILKEAMAPGASIPAVARKYGVNANLVFGWLRLHRRGLHERSRGPAVLLPVKVTTPTLLPDRESRLAKMVEPTARRRQGSGRVDIGMSGNVKVWVQGRIEREALGAMVAVVRVR